MSCNIFRSAESLKLIGGLNAAPFTDHLDLAGKGIREIEPGAFAGLASVEELELQGVAPSPVVDGTGATPSLSIDPRTGKPGVSVLPASASMNRLSKPLSNVRL